MNKFLKTNVSESPIRNVENTHIDAAVRCTNAAQESGSLSRIPRSSCHYRVEGSSSLYIDIFQAHNTPDIREENPSLTISDTTTAHNDVERDFSLGVLLYDS